MEQEKDYESLVKDVAQKILDKFSEDKVIEMLDEEIFSGNWLDGDWEDEYEDAFDAYTATGRGSAEDEIIRQMVDWYQSEYGKIDNDDMIDDVILLIKEEYEILDYINL